MMTKELSCGILTVEDHADAKYDGVNLLIKGTKVVVLECNSHAKSLQLRFRETVEDAPSFVRLAVPLVREATK